MHAHGFDPLWLTIAGLTLVVGWVFLWTVARAAARAEDCPDRERPDLRPDAETADWCPPAPHPPAESSAEYRVFLGRLGLNKGPRPGEED